MFRGIRALFKKKSDREESPESSLPRRKNGCEITSGNATRSDFKVAAGWAMTRGRRVYNEDNVFCEFRNVSKGSSGAHEDVTELEVGCIGVFDGHGGAAASEYVKGNLFESILGNEKFPIDVFKALEEGFVKTDTMYTALDATERNDDGCTGTAALILENKLYVAHVGDSRAVLGETNGVVAITKDHKPDRVDERKRIEDVGGTVIHAGTWRVSGVLAVSRSFGNRLMKQFVVAHPEIRHDVLHESTKCLIVASDGLWDVFSNKDAVVYALKFDDPEEAAKSMVKEAYDRGSFDNISCVVCFFHYENKHEGDFAQQADTALRD